MNETITLEKSAFGARKLYRLKKRNYFSIARNFVEKNNWRFGLYKFLYRSKTFSLSLLVLILVSSSAVVLQTVDELKSNYFQLFQTIEWTITILFTLEYFLRLLACPLPSRYALSRFGILDFFAVFPFYLSFWNLIDVNFLLVIRLIRLFRLVRVFNLIEYSKYNQELRILLEALQNSRRKISIFILSVLIAVTILGSIMYVVEGKENGFVSIPKGIYWAVVTISTVGYGDVAPKTTLGQLIASVLMLLGFSTIVVFTSIVGAEIYKQSEQKKLVLDKKSCLDCGMSGHDADASYCKHCGSRLWDVD